MGVDTFLVVPTTSVARARRAFADEEDTMHVGADYVALYRPDPFSGVSADLARFGPQYARELPAWMKKELDPRGILVVPQVGQAFAEPTYADVVASAGAPLFLPIRVPRAARTKRRLLLVALSQNRRRLVEHEPSLVRKLVDDRAKRAIPGSLELDDVWIDLQKALFDVLAGLDDPAAEVLAPRVGLPLYEDKVVELARLVPPGEVLARAAWLARLPVGAIERLPSGREETPASRAFPGILGPCDADDDVCAATKPRAPGRRKRTRPAAELQHALERVRAFYAEHCAGGQALLAIRFRA